MPKKIEPKAFVTNETLDHKLREVVDIILQGMDRMIGNLRNDLREEFTTSLKRLDGKMEKRFDKVDTNIRFLKHDVKDLEQELSVTPSIRQFNELKGRVDRHLFAS